MMRLKRILESWMGVEPVAAGEDTQWKVRFSIGWPDWVLFLFAVLSVAFVVYVYLKENPNVSRRWRMALACVRLAVLFLIVVMVSGLEIVVDRTGLPYLVLMVDDSESMRTRDRRADKSNENETGEQLSPRLERVQSFLTKDETRWASQLLQQHKLQLYAGSSSLRRQGDYVRQDEIPALTKAIRDLAPDGQESRLGGALRQALNNLRGAPPSSVVFFTDGVTTDGETLTQAAEYARRKNVPLFTVGVGDPERIRDLMLSDLLVDDTVFVDDFVNFEASLSSQGFEGQAVKIALTKKGSDTPIEEKSLTAPADGKPMKFRLIDQPDKEGVVEYKIEVAPLPKETLKRNNQIHPILVNVVKEKTNVLLVESTPRYEFRFLKNLLERQPTVDLKVLLLDSDPDYVKEDRAAIGFFPTNKQELLTYDVLILGDVSPGVFSQMQLESIRDFVKEKGGGLLLVSGPRFTPAAYKDSQLADLLPIEPLPGQARVSQMIVGAPFSPRRTVDGRFHALFRFVPDETENDAIWSALPLLYSYARCNRVKPTAQVLAEHPSDRMKDGRAYPLVATQYYGAGRVLFQAFDSTWRWRYRAEDYYCSRYWLQAIRYLSRSRLLGKNRNVELLVDRKVFRRGEPIPVRVRFLDEAQAPKAGATVTIALEQEGKSQRSFELKKTPNRSDLFETTLGQLDDGFYRIRMTNPTVEGVLPTQEFTVTPPPGELDRVQMNEVELKQAAEMTGGAYFNLDAADDVWAKLPPGRKVALHTDAPFPLWNTWPMLILVTLLLVVEWVARKRLSML